MWGNNHRWALMTSAGWGSSHRGRGETTPATSTGVPCPSRTPCKESHFELGQNLNITPQVMLNAFGTLPNVKSDVLAPQGPKREATNLPRDHVARVFGTAPNTPLTALIARNAKTPGQRARPRQGAGARVRCATGDQSMPSTLGGCCVAIVELFF